MLQQTPPPQSISPAPWQGPKEEEVDEGVPGSLQTHEPPDAIGFQEQTHPGVPQDPPHVPKPPPQTEEAEEHPGP